MKYFGLPKYLEYWKRAICSRASDYAFVVSDWIGKPRKLLMLQLIEEQGHFRGKPKGGGGKRLCWLSNQLLNCSSIAGNPNWPTQASCVCSAHADRVWRALWQRGRPGEFYCKYTPVCVCVCECAVSASVCGYFWQVWSWTWTRRAFLCLRGGCGDQTSKRKCLHDV